MSVSSALLIPLIRRQSSLTADKPRSVKAWQSRRIQANPILNSTIAEPVRLKLPPRNYDSKSEPAPIESLQKQLTKVHRLFEEAHNLIPEIADRLGAKK
jgi:hypothetical protein